MVAKSKNSKPVKSKLAKSKLAKSKQVKNKPVKNVYPPQVAGQFYLADPVALTAMLDRCLAQAAKYTHLPASAPKAIIAPHAGHRFSGPYAAVAYHHLTQGKHNIKRVVMLGPAHKTAFEGLAINSSTAMQTPLGNVAIDGKLAKSLARKKSVSLNNAPFEGEHCLEVHLPFLQRCLESFSIVPIIVGRVDASVVHDLLNTVWDLPETVVLISSDLSHFHDQPTAQGLDSQTRRAIELLDDSALVHTAACGATPAKGLIQLAKQRGLRPTTLSIGTSGDRGGDKSRVVGYGSWRFDDLDTAQTPKVLQRELIRVATKSIGIYGRLNKLPTIAGQDSASTQLTNTRATFISLALDGELRGCIGTLQAHRSLLEDVAHNAVSAAFKDGRFKPLSFDEYRQLEISISILSHATELEFTDEEDLLQQLSPGEDGLLLTAHDPQARATFLPMVWDKISEPTLFLQALKRKAGLPIDYWSDTLKFRRYKAEKFSMHVEKEIAARFKW